MARKIDKEGYNYYKILYRANLKRAIQRGFADPTAMLSEGEWQRAHDIFGDSNSDIVYQQTHKYSRKTSEAIKKALEEAGYKINKRKTFDSYTQEEKEQLWDITRNVYKELRDLGLTGKEAKEKIEHRLYGSE